MSEQPGPVGEELVQALLSQPLLLVRLAANALAVAESLRENYFRNTARFIGDLRRALRAFAEGRRAEVPVRVFPVEGADWAEVQGEVVTFIDGGIGRVQIAGQVPILLRVGSYCVRTGDRRLAERERFGYYPVVLGDLEGGSKHRRDFPDLVRIIAEVLGGLAAMERTPDLRVLVFHGPLVYLMGGYAGHAPFTEHDIDLLLRHYAPDPRLARDLKEGFLAEARRVIYPRLLGDQAETWIRQRHFEPLAWLAYLYRRLIALARQRQPVPLIIGVVERSDLRQFLERVLLVRVFQGLEARGRSDYFNRLYGRRDLISPQAVLDRLGYTDALLLGLLLQPGQYSEPWEIEKYEGLRERSTGQRIDFAALRPGPIGFPRVHGFYLKVSETTEPLRVEVFSDLGEHQVAAAARRVYLYARLLPGYGFPVGLDVVDKYARVPAWLLAAYAKLIRYHLGVSLQSGEISDAEVRRLLVQAVYLTQRDWLFRPSAFLGWSRPSHDAEENHG